MSRLDIYEESPDMSEPPIGGQQEPSWLVLLTTAPSTVSFASLKAAYGPALFKSLKTVSAASKATRETKILDIAVPYSAKGHASGAPRCSQYPELQSLLGQMYTLLCFFCTQLSIDVDHGNDVDARIILIDNATDHQVCGFDLQSLAVCKRPWKHIYFINCPEGESLSSTFLQTRKAHDLKSVEDLDVQGLDAGADATNPEQNVPGKKPARTDEFCPHYSVAVGGTFDHLHIGHKLLLTMTALVLETDHEKTRTLTIGITGDALLKNKRYVEVLQDWGGRQSSVRSFLLSILEPDPPSHPTSRTIDQETGARFVRDDLKSGLVIHYAEIFDAFGPTITDEKISALVISGETRAGGKAINDRREEKGWRPLEVFEVDVLNAHNDKGSGSAEAGFEDKISSTEIRRRLHLRHARSERHNELTAGQCSGAQP